MTDPQKILGQNLTCSNCRFSISVRPNAQSIQTQLVCKFFPPSMVCAPTAQGPAIMPCAVVVNEKEWCWQYQPRPSVPQVLSASEPPLDPSRPA